MTGAFFVSSASERSRDAPYAFSSSVARESGHGPEFWEDRVAESRQGVDSLVTGAVEAGQPLGMAGGFMLREERGVAMVWGMCVAPGARRGGTGQTLLKRWLTGPGTPERIACTWR